MSLLLLALLAKLAAAVAGALRARRPDGWGIVYGMSLGAAVLAALGALLAAPGAVVLPLGLPWIGVHLRLDALAAFFLLVVNLGAAAASLFALDDARHETAPERVLPFYPAFLAGLDLVVLADDALTFLFAWELMSLASWALVIAHHRESGNLRAGLVYLLMAGLSALALLFAFGLLAGTGGHYTFAAMRAAPPAGAAAGIALMLALFGAGAKAGIVPLHAWLPLAHPAAPSHVSALMSGVMTKVALYAFIRIGFDLLGATPWWSAVVLLALGGATAVLGILYALMQGDLKRLLAYSTVENIGIICIGLGLAMAFRSAGYAAGAALALTAALLHVFNHAMMKSLLFFGAGTVLHATGLREMDGLGGLLHRMPRTGFAVLVGCAAIAALPPLNGFVSEWLTLQAIMLRPDLPQWGLKVMIPTDGALLALAAALAGACFVKLFGVSFLGRARSAATATAADPGRLAQSAMLGLAMLCLLAGVLPGALIDLIAPVTNALLGARMPTQLAQPWLTLIPVAAARSSYNGLLIFAFIAAATWLTVRAVHRFASHDLRRAPAWDCGFPDLPAAAQYGGDSFAQPLRRVFAAPLFGARETVELPPPGSVAPPRIEKHLPDPLWEILYAPVGSLVLRLADVMNRLQFLTIRRYLAFVFIALVALLLAIALWQ